jgi:hypothetical protein
MNYYEKYFKYKNKYLELKKFQNYGGEISNMPITICGIELQRQVDGLNIGFNIGNGVWVMSDNNGIQTFYVEVPTTATIYDRLETLYNDHRYNVRTRMNAAAGHDGFFNSVTIQEIATGITLSTRY